MRIILILLLFPLASKAQLPVKELIHSEKVKSIEVRYHPIASGFNQDRVYANWHENVYPNDTTPVKTALYFFSENADLDSIQYEQEGKIKTMIYEYDAYGRVISQKYASKDGVELEQAVNTLENGNLEFKGWRNGLLVDHYVALPDSTILTIYRPKAGNGTRFTYDYNPETNTARFTSFIADRAVSYREEHWTNHPNGQDSVFVAFEQIIIENNLPKTLHETYIVQSDGSLNPEYESHKMAPQLYGNLRKGEFIVQYDHFDFNAFELTERSEIYTVPSYTPEQKSGYYTFIYDFREEK